VIRALVVDDEPLARDGIRTLLEAEPGFEVAGACATGIEAVEAIREREPDLVFLDVQMPDLDGFGVLEALGPGEMPIVVFVTAYDEYAIRAFEVHAVDYLLKPFDRERLARTLRRVERMVTSSRLDRGLRSLLEHVEDRPVGPRRGGERLVLRDAGRIKILRVNEITRVEAAGNYVEIHAGGKVHLTRSTLKGFHGRLDPGRFVRIGRSLVVNIDRVTELRTLEGGRFRIFLEDGVEVESSRRYRDVVEAALGPVR